MKILICHNNSEVLSRLMERPLAAKNVVIPCFHGQNLITTLAATEPHLVVLGGDKLGASPTALERRLREAGFDTPTLILHDERPDNDGLDEIWRYLQRLPRCLERLQADSQEYQVVTEREFKPGTSREGDSAETVEWQENRFLTLLEAGSIHHSRAQTYLRLTTATERHYELDWASAVLSGDAMAYLWRVQLFRYVSVLAHYVPGVEVGCLPLPEPASRTCDFLHTTLSAEAYYALNAIRTLRTNPEFDARLWELGQIETNQGPRLADDAARLAGWASIVRETATAHVEVMEACLSKEPTRVGALQQTRHSRNCRSVFLRLWGLTRFLSFPEELQRLVKEFQAGRRPEGAREFCSFHDFLDHLQQSAQEQLAKN